MTQAHKCPQIQRIDILQDIFDCFQQITQWIPRNLDSCAEYIYKATSLIELLEVSDCESIGGFDPDNPLIQDEYWNLYNRFLTLLQKYHNTKDIKRVCYFTPESLRKYFIEVEKVRERFNV